MLLIFLRDLCCYYVIFLRDLCYYHVIFLFVYCCYPLLGKTDMTDCAVEGFSFCWFTALLLCLILELYDLYKGCLFCCWLNLNVLSPMYCARFPVNIQIESLEEWVYENCTILFKSHHVEHLAMCLISQIKFEINIVGDLSLFMFRSISSECYANCVLSFSCSVLG